MVDSRYRLIYLLPFLVVLASCAVNNSRTIELSRQLEAGASPERTLSTLAESDVNKRDLVQRNLNLGYLRLITGDFIGAVDNLSQAKEMMIVLEAKSIREGVGASTVNENMRSYRGNPTDRILVHGMLALSYLMLGDLEGARVEALQSDVQLQKLAERGPLVGQLASMRFISGSIYELNGEWSNALISYRKAKEILQQRHEPLPESLKLSLLNLTKKVGLTDEHNEYAAQFSELVEQSQKLSNTPLFVFYFDGLVSEMRSNTIPIWYDINNVYLNVAVPRYGSENYLPKSISVFLESSVSPSDETRGDLQENAAIEEESSELRISSVDLNDQSGTDFIEPPASPRNTKSPSANAKFPSRFSGKGGIVKSESIEDIEKRVREDLDIAMPGIVAAATVRAISKYKAVRQMDSQDSALGILANIMTLATEIADTRSWTMLPSSIQVLRVDVDEPLQAKIKGIALPDNTITLGKKQAYLISSLGPRIYHANLKEL